MNKSMSPLVALIILFSAAMNAHAAGTSSSSWPMQEQKNKPAVSLYDQGVQASKNNDF